MKNKNKLILVFILAIMFSTFSLPEKSYASEWKFFTQGVKLMEKGNYAGAIIEFKKATEISSKASTYRKLAISYEKTKQYQKAAETYYLEAEIYRSLGDMDTYQAVKNIGDALNTEIKLYTNQDIQLPKQELGKYEPERGMYVGAYIELGGLLGNYVDKYTNFNKLTKKKHAVYFTYHNYGTAFPTKFANEVKQAGGAIQLALEPNKGLNEVQDNEYLRKFAREAKASGVPIFLRFASEMNGPWVAWHDNPAQYKKKFALVHKIMKEEAPNVAMAWVPNSVPFNNIDDYYPGDEFVDWVGLNLYSVPFFNGDSSQPAEHVNPLDLIDEFYNKYATKKPMMIGEYAASHFTSVGNQDVTQFGITKMKMFYTGLKMKYPKVKSIHWFNVDTINGQYIKEDRRLNNFDLLKNTSMLSAYTQTLNDAYYLSNVVNGPLVGQDEKKPKISVPLEQNTTLYHSVDGSGFVKTYDPKISKVVYLLNGSKLSESKEYPYQFSLEHHKLRSGSNKFTAIVYDSKGREAGRKEVSFKKGPHITKAKKNSLNLFVDDITVFDEEGALQLLAPVYEKNGRSLVPLRFISETIGASVGWDKKKKQIAISSGDKKIVLTEGSKVVYVNNEKRTIDVPAEIRNGTTFVPIRFITEVLGAVVDYDRKTNGIEISFH
ncbi:stalk domain-containing protein [Sporosarcina siberiensis]|uniref:Stalk domain-containing protein n=1 Tax=Sporosarcina siberiensis TaxID=1365606 RepID=A0ABW4SIH8_9BACL